MPLRVADRENIRVSGEKIEYTPEILKEYIKCKEDILYFAAKYFYIINIDKGKQLFELWPCQKRVLRDFENPPNGKKFNILLSSRQVGKSTIAACYILHYALFNEDKFCMILANKEKSAINILRKIKFAFSNMPKWMQQGITGGAWNKKGIEFENGSRIEISSTSATAARSESISLLYIDEFAFIPDSLIDEFMASVYPTIVSGQNSKIIIVSTVNGLNAFFEIWKKAEANENSFHPTRVNWWEIPGRGQAFKETTIKDIGLQRWLSEFEGKFLGSTSTLVDGNILENLKFIEPIDIKHEGMLLIYEKPIDNALYICGADVSKGVGKDSSIVVVLRIEDTFKIYLSAIYANNKIGPREFGKIIVNISELYNNANIIIESNDIGHITANFIWFDLECDRILNFDKNEIGIRANNKTKMASDINMKRYIENDFIKINDKKTIFELSKYEEVKPNIFGTKSQEDHDDRVRALSWALYYIISPFYDPENIKKAANKDKDEDNDLPLIMVYDDGSESSDWLLNNNKNDRFHDFGFAG